MDNEKSVHKKKRDVLGISVDQFVKKYSLDIDFDADYQREKIWTTKQQSELIDSILKDIDIPKIYLAKSEGESNQFSYECIDGKQRMTAILRFIKPDLKTEKALTVERDGDDYTFENLKEDYPKGVERLLNYELSFVIYEPLPDSFIREIFRRLQLGVRLNSGEILNSLLGSIRDFVFEEIGYQGPFLRNTKLSEKRYSRQFTLAQICLNSFSKTKHGGEFVRTRLTDIEDFFAEYRKLKKDDHNFLRIKNVLTEMDSAFKSSAIVISSRAIAVSAYLFCEELFLSKRKSEISSFAKFYVKMLGEIKEDLERIGEFEKPLNTKRMDEFQKYILQASVEPSSIKRRHEYLKKEFKIYQNRRS